MYESDIVREQCDLMNEKEEENCVISNYIQSFNLQNISECQKVLFEMLNQNSNFLANVGEAEGKVLAYGLPLLKTINTQIQETQAIIFAQDRQEVVKIFYILKTYAKLLGIDLLIINTGISISDQIVRLRRKSHIIISTPVRLLEHMEMGTFDFSHVKTIVFDKVNKDGMESEFDKINCCLDVFYKKNTQVNYWVLCSKNTFTQFQEIFDKKKTQYFSIVLQEETACSDIRYFYAISNSINKMHVLSMVLEGLLIESKIAIIANTKIHAESIKKILLCQGFNAHCITGNEQQVLAQQFNPLYIVPANLIKELEKYNCTHIIAMNASVSFKELQSRALFAKHNPMGPILIELTTKYDNGFISSLRQNTNIVVQKFIFPSSYESRFIKMLRINNYLESIVNQASRQEGDGENIAKEVFDTYSIDDLRNILLHILEEKISDISHAFVLLIEKPSTLQQNERLAFKVIFYGQRINEYSKETLMSYCLANNKIPSAAIQKTVMLQEKVIFYVRDIDKEILLEYIAENPIDGVFVSIENVFYPNYQQSSYNNNYNMHQNNKQPLFQKTPYQQQQQQPHMNANRYNQSNNNHAKYARNNSSYTNSSQDNFLKSSTFQKKQYTPRGAHGSLEQQNEVHSDLNSHFNNEKITANNFAEESRNQNFIHNNSSYGFFENKRVPFNKTSNNSQNYHHSGGRQQYSQRTNNYTDNPFNKKYVPQNFEHNSQYDKKNKVNESLSNDSCNSGSNGFGSREEGEQNNAPKKRSNFDFI